MKTPGESVAGVLSPVAGLLPEGKTWFTSKEAATVIGRSAQYVRDCFDNQKIMGHALNSRSTPGGENRKSYQIPRAALQLYLMETANYRGSDFADRVYSLASALQPVERRKLAERLKSGASSVWAG